MENLLYQENSFWTFVFITLGFGGWASRIAGRALASTWRPSYLVPLTVLLVATAVRFLHFALFQTPLFSAHYFLVDYTATLGFAAWGYYTRKAELMSTLYPWLFKRRGLLTWRPQRDLS